MGSQRAIKPTNENSSLERMRGLLAQCQGVARQMSGLSELIGDDDRELDDRLIACLEAQKKVISEVEWAVNELELVGEQRTSDALTDDPRYVALYDELTGLPSRTLFHSRMQSAFVLASELGWTVSVMFIDLDKFKAINDTYGHEMGDEVLKVLGQRFKSSVRDTDVVSRYGGDEFVVLLMDVRADVNLAKIAAKILEQVSLPIAHRDVQISVHASIGIARRPQDGDDSEALIRSADQAMYRAKKNMMGYAFANRGVEAEVIEPKIARA